MPWFRDVPVVVFFFALGLVLLLAVLGLGMAFWSGRITGALRGRKPVAVNALAPGYQLIDGQASGPLLTAPLTGRPCVWWNVRVWERGIQHKHDTRPVGARDGRADWVEQRHEQSSRALQCTQGLVTCAVQPAGITLAVPTELADWQGMHNPPESRHPPAQPGTAFASNPSQDPGYAMAGGTLVQGARFRYREEIIVPNAPLYVLGRVERVDPAQWAHDPQPPAFDAVSSHQNSASAPAPAQGHADFESSDWGDEEDDAEAERERTAGRRQTQYAQYEADRQLAADLRQAQWQIGPQKGQPYIVAAQPPEQWLGMAQQASKGGWIMGTLFAALAVFLLWARYGPA